MQDTNVKEFNRKILHDKEAVTRAGVTFPTAVCSTALLAPGVAICLYC